MPTSPTPRSISVVPFTGPLSAQLAAPFDGDGIRLWWLGQAGFALLHGDTLILIDPYLSDHLARKYAGTDKPHDRLMPSPVSAGDATGLDLVLCTHKHSDHMDPQSLPVLAANNPECRFVIPKAEEQHTRSLGIDSSRLLPMDAGETISVDGVSVSALASAHEDFSTDADGRHRFLGYILRLGDVAIYHSGDCVVYPGLADLLADAAVDLALLPVNGRDARRQRLGTPGNMRIDEAIGLCESAAIPILIPHHFGMFAFNTIDRIDIEKGIPAHARTVQCRIPSVEVSYVLTI